MGKSLKEMTEKEKGCVLLVDALNLAFRYKHNNSKNFADDYLRTINSLASSYKAEKVYVLCDEGHSTFRKNILPEYKQARKEKFAEQTEEEKQAFAEFFQDFNRALDLVKLNHKVFKFKGVEADDLAAYIVKNKDLFKIQKIWLVSSDKDWDLLISDSVSRFSYVTRKEVTAENWNDHYEVSREEYISLKCLTGDSGDSIPGVEGIGPKRALSLIEKYGDALEIYNNIPLNGSYVYIKNLNNSGDLILKNYELMDILSYCEEAIGKENLEILVKELTSDKN